MNAYREFMKQPLDPFKLYSQNDNPQMLQDVAYSIKNISKQCHKQCFQSNDEKCVESCAIGLFKGMEALVKQL
ncbi:hypothetical protein pb186bvf_003375 [Paramecium bursaria]